MIKQENTSSVKPLDGVMAESDNKEEELDATKAKVEKAREENEKLKVLLSTVLSDYNSLQVHVSNVLRQQNGASTELDIDSQDKHHDLGLDISLRLGRSEQIISQKEDKVDKTSDENETGLEKKISGLALGFQIQSCDDPSTDGASKLDHLCRHLKNATAENKCESSKKDVKTARNVKHQDVLEEHEQVILKKTRVCVKAACEDPSINDGCQWRKYGQKTAKPNPLPRAYYRCSMSTTCPVQRCGEEETSAFMTTYKGNHDHPLPMEATHMAAGTFAATSLLQSGSSSSSSSAILSHFFPYYHFSVSTTNSHPTVTLDLTRTNYQNQLLNHPLSSSSFSLNFSSSKTPPPSSYDHTLSFGGLRTQAPLSTDSVMARLSHRTKLSGQQKIFIGFLLSFICFSASERDLVLA